MRRRTRKGGRRGRGGAEVRDRETAVLSPDQPGHQVLDFPTGLVWSPEQRLSVVDERDPLFLFFSLCCSIIHSNADGVCPIRVGVVGGGVSLV